MIRKLVYLCVVLSGGLAAPPTDVVPLEKQQPTVIPIVSQSEELEANGTYKFSYETGNGIKREEVSFDKVAPKTKERTASHEGDEVDDSGSNEIHVQQGSYSYTAPDGTIITLRYIADEFGFRPIGDHLPKAPALQGAPSLPSSNKKNVKPHEKKVTDSTASEPVPLSRSAIEPELVESKNMKSNVSTQNSSVVKATEALKSENKSTEAKQQDNPEKDSTTTVSSGPGVTSKPTEDVKKSITTESSQSSSETSSKTEAEKAVSPTESASSKPQPSSVEPELSKIASSTESASTKSPTTQTEAESSKSPSTTAPASTTVPSM